MTDETPLNVRVAEALGWECGESPLGRGRTVWVGIGPGGTWMWGGREIPPYGEESSAGWAVTGPLIARFGLRLEPLLDGRWVACRDISKYAGQAVIEGSPSPAAGEWVARYVKEGMA